MPKHPIPLAPDTRPDRPRRRRLLPILALFVTVPLLAPVIMDAVALCYGQWREVLGAPSDVRTPTLDVIGERIEEVREGLWYQASCHFNRVPWNPRVVLPIAVVVMVMAMVMLRL
jgi:hypothetical protein